MDEEEEEIGGGGGGGVGVGVGVREWAPFTHLLSRIPAKAQRGLSTLPLHLTSIASDGGQYLALGTNVGLIYAFNRGSLALTRLKTQNTGSVISKVAIISSPPADLILGAGNAEGQLFIFTLSTASGRVMQFELRGGRVHEGVAISSLEWSSNGLKLFSGDIGGGVALTQLDFDHGVGEVGALTQERGEIVGLSYLRQHLLISSTHQSTLLSLSTNITLRVGSQERKIAGRFGGLWRRCSLTEPPTLYSVRPGGRLWLANAQGVVQHTIKFKELLLEGSYPLIPLINPSTPPSNLSQRDFQIRSLWHWKSSSLVTTASITSSASSSGGGGGGSNVLLLLDPINSRILGVCNELGRILDVAVNGDAPGAGGGGGGGGGEIFVLQSNRNVIRLSSHPDPYPTTTPTSTTTTMSMEERWKRSPNPFFHFRNLPQMMPTNATLKAKELMMSGMSMDSGTLGALLKETSRRVAGPVHQTSSTIFQGLKQVFEGEVEDGLWPIPLPPPSPTSIMSDTLINHSDEIAPTPTNGQISPSSWRGDEEEPHPELAMGMGMDVDGGGGRRRDKFGHISHLPFDDVLLTPTTKPSSAITGGMRKRRNKKNRRKVGGGGGEGEDDKMDGVDGGGLEGRGGSLSNSSYSIQSDDELAVNGSGKGGGENEDGIGPVCSLRIPPSMVGVDIMSQSWSVGQQQPQQVADEVLSELKDGDLESKEELLAQKLGWPELLPESKRSTFVIPTPALVLIPPPEEPETIESHPPMTELKEKQESEECTVGNNGALGGVAEGNNSLSSLEESLDIYTRYRDPEPPDPPPDKDPQEPVSGGGAYPSSSLSLDGVGCLSFGPPSSNTSNSNPLSLTQLQPKIIEIQENGIPSSFTPCSSSSHSNSEEQDSQELILKKLKLQQLSPSPEDSCFSFQNDELLPIRDMVVESIPHDNWLSFSAAGPLESLAVCDSYILVLDRRKRVYVAQLPSHQQRRVSTPSSSSSSSPIISSLRWIQVEWSGEAVGLSPCGSVLWRLMGGTLYSLMDPISSLFPPPLLHEQGPPKKKGEPSWSRLLSDVSSFTLDRHVGWVIKRDGSLHFATGPLVSGVIPQFQPLTTPAPLHRIVLAGGDGGQEEGRRRSLWGLTVDGRVLYRRGMSDDRVAGVGWVPIPRTLLPSSSAPICSLAWVGSSLFLADSDRNLYFIPAEEGGGGDGGMDPSTLSVWRVNMGEYLVTSSSPNGDGGTGGGFSLSGLRAKLLPGEGRSGGGGGSLFSTSAASSKQGNPILGGGGGGLWWSLRGSSTLHSNLSLVTGHGWESLEVSRPLRKSGCGRWVGLMASIYLDHGVLWLLDNKGKLFYSKPGGGEAKSIDLPTSSGLSAVIPAPDALWILSQEGVIWGRDNISPHNPIGHGWTTIDLSSQERLHLVHVSCGCDVAWGCDVEGRVYFRIGSLRPPVSPKDMSPPWVQIEDDAITTPTSSSSNSSRSSPRIKFRKVYVGTNGSMVWALDTANNIYVREAVFPDFPIGTRWLLVSGLEAVSLSLSERSVWALSPKKGGATAIFRRTGISKNNFVGDDWTRIPGPGVEKEAEGGAGEVVDLTVSLCDQMWALDGAGWVGRHCSKTLRLGPRPGEQGPPPTPKPRTILDPEDREWELIESLDLI